MDLSKQFIDRLGEKLTHHDLIVIECVLSDHFQLMYGKYRNLSELVSKETSSRKISRLMQSLCRIYDRMIEIRTVLKCFDDIRNEDYINGSYK